MASWSDDVNVLLKCLCSLVDSSQRRSKFSLWVCNVHILWSLFVSRTHPLKASVPHPTSPPPLLHTMLSPPPPLLPPIPPPHIHSHTLEWFEGFNIFKKIAFLFFSCQLSPLLVDGCVQGLHDLRDSIFLRNRRLIFLVNFQFHLYWCMVVCKVCGPKLLCHLFGRKYFDHYVATVHASFLVQKWRTPFAICHRLFLMAWNRLWPLQTSSTARNCAFLVHSTAFSPVPLAHKVTYDAKSEWNFDLGFGELSFDPDFHDRLSVKCWVCWWWLHVSKRLVVLLGIRLGFC